MYRHLGKQTLEENKNRSCRTRISSNNKGFTERVFMVFGRHSWPLTKRKGGPSGTDGPPTSERNTGWLEPIYYCTIHTLDVKI